MRKIRRIDQGGFGIVDEVDVKGKRLARKTFNPQILDAGEREKLAKRFVREVQVQSEIKHPNIMPIVESDLVASPPWYTMPLAACSFKTRIKKDNPTGAVDPAPWQDILAAVEELHRLGYVHRDIRPDNILLVGDKWVLADFGLILPISATSGALTGSQTRLGSEEYAAPEQRTDFHGTPEQADIFSLGCVLHDLVGDRTTRTPYAQIRCDGPYGVILEKCTEHEPHKRFPTIAALRAALYDLWQTSEFDGPAPAEANVLEAVINSPTSEDAWRRLVKHTENLPKLDRRALLQSINAELLASLRATDADLFERMMSVICDWAESTGFDWAYCDVVGDRLLEAYKLGSVRVRSKVVLATLDLAVSHNRWHVMYQAGEMLGLTSDNNLVDRFIIEMKLNESIESNLRRIEDIVHWKRNQWHTKIETYLNAKDLELASSI